MITTVILFTAYFTAGVLVQVLAYIVKAVYLLLKLGKIITRALLQAAESLTRAAIIAWRHISTLRYSEGFQEPFWKHLQGVRSQVMATAADAWKFRAAVLAEGRTTI